MKQVAFNFTNDEIAEELSVPEDSDVCQGYRLLSDAQRLTLQTNKFARMLVGKSLAEIEAFWAENGNTYYKRSKTEHGKLIYDEVIHAYWACQTLALEKLYRAKDVRFCEEQTGVFYLVGDDGNPNEVRFLFTPNRFDRKKIWDTRDSLPLPHIEFFSDELTEISSTGYLSHYLTQIPIGEVSDFDDFFVKILRLHLELKTTIIYNNTLFDRVPGTENPKKKKCRKKASPKRRQMASCSLCGASLTGDGECAECGHPDGDEKI